MERLPVLETSQMSGLHQQNTDNVAKLYSAFPSSLEHKQDNGKLYGCFHTLHYSPDLIQPWWNLAFAVVSQKELSVREKELAIMATLAVYETPFHRYMHKKRAVEAGFTPEQARDGFESKLPDGLSEVDVAVYKLAKAVAESTGPIAEEAFEEASKLLSREKIVAAVHMVCGYFYVSKLAAIGDMELPDAAKAHFGV